MMGSLVLAGGGRLVILRGEGKMVFFVEGRFLSLCTAGRHRDALKTLAFNVAIKTKTSKDPPMVSIVIYIFLSFFKIFFFTMINSQKLFHFKFQRQSVRIPNHVHAQKPIKKQSFKDKSVMKAGLQGYRFLQLMI